MEEFSATINRESLILGNLKKGWNRNLRRGGPMAQSLMAGMRLKYFIKEKDPDHVISWRDFLKFFSIAVRRYPKKGFQHNISTS